MRRSPRPVLGLLLCLSLCSGSARSAEDGKGQSFAGTFEAAGAKFYVEPPLVRVTTDRLEVDIVDMCVSQVKDKKAGRSFCRAGKNTAGGRAFLELQDYRPGRGTRTFTHVPGDQSAQLPAAVDEWVVLKPTQFTSAVGGTAKVEDDGAVLVSGKNGQDTYTFTTVVPPGVTPLAIRLEALPDVSLPGHGPGRSANGTFVVTAFAVAAGPAGTKVPLTGATADTEEPNFAVAGAIDDKPETGWSTGGEGGRPHQATFTIDPAAKLAAGTPLVVTIEQRHSAEHTIGKVRLALMHRPQAAKLAMAAAPRTHVKKLDRGVEYTVTGLVSEQADKQYYPDAMLGLRIEHDQKTGDLVLTMLGAAGRPEQFGAFDEGIRSAQFTLGPFKSDVKMINPDGNQGPIRDFWLTWPLNIPANLLIFESPQGSCLGLWADDEKLEYGKAYACGSNVLRVTTISGDAPWMTGRMAAPIWRLNVFDSWEGAGRRYVDTMERTLGVTPLEKREPAWARDIRFVAHQVFGLPNFKTYYLDKGVPKEALMEWDTQGWLNGYATEIMSPKRPEWFPNFPFDHATHYEGHPGYLQSVKDRQAFGIPCFPYTCMYVHMSEPFRKDSRVLRAPDKDFQCGGRMWWVLYADMCKDIVAKYGVRGIYDDCSWIGPEYDPRGRVDGLTVWQAHAQGRRHLRDSLLPVAFMGERQHEFTIISDMIALMWIGGEVHPINNFLFGRYTLRWSQAEEIQQGNYIGRGYCDSFEVHNSLDAAETLGCISMHSTGRYVDVGSVLQEPKLINKRMYFIPREKLTSYYPAKYEPGVVGYLRGKDGTEYRTKSQGGVGLVRLTKDKQEQVVWWRSRGAEASLPGAAIEGWVAYDGDKAIGLNPALRYCALEGVARPPAVITSLPAGAHLTLSRVHDGYWVAAVGGQNLPPAVEIKVAATGGKRLAFVGAEAVSGPDAAGTYTVKVAPGRWLTAGWAREPLAATAPMELPTPGQLAFVTHDTGVPMSLGGPKGKELWFDFAWLLKVARQGDWLLKIPAGGGKFTATVVDQGKTTAEVRVRVDGEVVAKVPHQPGQKTPLAVPLDKFAGKTVLVSLDIDVGDGAAVGVTGAALAAP